MRFQQSQTNYLHAYDKHDFWDWLENCIKDYKQCRRMYCAAGTLLAVLICFCVSCSLMMLTSWSCIIFEWQLEQYSDLLLANSSNFLNGMLMQERLLFSLSLYQHFYDPLEFTVEKNFWYMIITQICHMASPM